MTLTTSVPMLISKQFDDEVVLANYQSGIYYNLDGTGAQIWLGLKAGKSVDEMVRLFADKTGSQTTVIDPQVRGFVDQLIAEGIVLPGAPELPEPDWTPTTRGQFASPALQRYDDLRDLLLMDPVHDAGEAGWPLRGGNES
jgi:hypothetical protein